MKVSATTQDAPVEERFRSVYDMADPRAYYRALAAVDYQTPYHVTAFIRGLLPTILARDTADRALALDLCCGYGANSALLRHRVAMDDLYRRYAASASAALTSEQVAAADKRFLASRRVADLRLQVCGLDIAVNALAYARRVGLIDYASGVDLTREAPDRALLGLLRNVDLIFESGGVFPTLAMLLSVVLDVARRPPWIVLAPTRIVDLTETRARLAGHGLALRPVGNPFPFRQFADREERDRCFAMLEARKLAATAIEESGYYAAQLHVAELGG